MLRWVRVVLGTLWAGTLLFAGLALLDAPVRALLAEAPALAGLVWGIAVWAVAGAQFVFLWFVADELVPGAPDWLAGFLKTTAAVVSMMALIWTLWQGVRLAW